MSYVLRKLRFLSEQKHVQYNEGATAKGSGADMQRNCISLEENLHNLTYALNNAQDVIVQPFRFGPQNRFAAALVYIDGMVDIGRMTDAILRPIKNWRFNEEEDFSEASLLDILEYDVLCAAAVENIAGISDLATGCLCGNTVLMVDGLSGGLVIDTKGWERREITEPQSESVVRGPREGFTEDIRTNISMIRRKIRNGHLIVEYLTVGRKSGTKISLLYLQGIANPKTIETVRLRINRLEVDAILETGYLEEYIEDAPFSLFGTAGYTEKPDVAAGKMLEGRVVITVDGTPFVLTVPFLFTENFQTSEDYYNRAVYASLMRILRYCGFFIAIFAPALYVALVSYQHELVPTTLMFSFIRAREGTPFPAFAEALIMVFTFELLREAGVRLPRPIGQTISIVGALIMGEAAVSAGVVGAPMVIAIAVTAVATFMVPTLNDAIIVLRAVMIILASTLGLYGVVFGFLGMLVHLATLESFGVKHLGDFDSEGVQDTLFRVPLWAMKKRPSGIAVRDTTRIHPFIPPLRPHKAGNEGDEP